MKINYTDCVLLWIMASITVGLAIGIVSIVKDILTLALEEVKA